MPLLILQMIVFLLNSNQEIRFFDSKSDEEITSDRARGSEYYKQTYDASGRPLQEEHFNAFGKPALDFEGIHKYIWKYDSMGRKICEEYQGINGEPARNHDGVCKYEWLYDSGGVLIEQRRTNLSGQIRVVRFDQDNTVIDTEDGE